jgi:hypothetical protein
MIRRPLGVVFFLASALSVGACVDGTLPRRTAQHPGNSSAPEGYAAAPLTALADEGQEGRAGPAVQEAGATAYVCPMHAEVVKSEPGSCPQCGMKLVPKTSRPKQGAAAKP